MICVLLCGTVDRSQPFSCINHPVLLPERQSAPAFVTTADDSLGLHEIYDCVTTSDTQCFDSWVNSRLQGTATIILRNLLLHTSTSEAAFGIEPGIFRVLLSFFLSFFISFFLSRLVRPFLPAHCKM
jgi:hypothetical protein